MPHAPKVRQGAPYKKFLNRLGRAPARRLYELQALAAGRRRWRAFAEADAEAALGGRLDRNTHRTQRRQTWTSIEAATAARTHRRIAQGTAALRHADARYRPAAAGRISATPTTHKPRVSGARRLFINHEMDMTHLALQQRLSTEVQHIDTVLL